MTDRAGPPDGLLTRRQELLEAHLRKGLELAEELIRENVRLGARIEELEAALPRAGEGESREGARWEERLAEAELENADLASLLVASTQLHAAGDPAEVLQVIVEILLNFVGAKRFAVLFLDERTGALHPAAAEGLERAELAPIPIGLGLAGRVAATGVAHLGPVADAGRPPADPAVCFPLRHRGRVAGLVAIWAFLVQKTALAGVDGELFDLLGAQAVGALEAARLAAEAGDRPRPGLAAFLATAAGG